MATEFVPSPGCPVTVMAVQAATGASTVNLALQRTSMSGNVMHMTWTTLTTGSPSAVTLNLEGSLDKVNWYTLDTSTSTTGEMRHVTNKAVPFVRMNLATLTGGTAPTVNGVVMIACP